MGRMSRDLRILAIETTGLAGSVAGLAGDRVLAARDLAAGRRSAQSLAPTIAQLWREVGWRAADVQLVAVTVGPGSFTGLRVGVTTAKTLAYATGAAVLGIDTLEAIAAQTPPPFDDVWSTFDAQRGEFFVARYRRTNPSDPLTWRRADLKPTLPTAGATVLGGASVDASMIVDGVSWTATLPSGSVVTGPPLARWRDRLPPGVIAVAATCWRPQAATVGRLAWRKHLLGERHDFWSLVPNYVRASAAEEKLASRKA